MKRDYQRAFASLVILSDLRSWWLESIINCLQRYKIIYLVCPMKIYTLINITNLIFLKRRPFDKFEEIYHDLQWT